MKHQPLIPFNVNQYRIILKQNKTKKWNKNFHFKNETYTKKVVLLFGGYANDEDPDIEVHLYETLIVHAQM